MGKRSIDEIARLCADCGTCQSACPVYRADLTEPNSPRGKVNLIKAVSDGRLKWRRATRRFVYECLLCGSCQTACPSKVEFVDAMLAFRNRISRGRNIPLFKKLVLFLYQPFIFKKIAPLLRWLAQPPLKKRIRLPRPEKADVKKWITTDRRPDYDVLLFPGCVLSHFYPAMVGKIIAFFEKQNLSLAWPPGLSCCGFPYLSQGWEKKFAGLLDRNKKVLSAYRFRSLVVPCATGAMTLRTFYGFPNVQVFELSEFVARFLPQAAVDPAFLANPSRTFTFHHPCHSIHSLKAKEAPETFLRQFGSRYVADSEELCCGFGGFFSLGFPATARKILERKRARLREIGAEAAVTSCPGCYLQLKENLPLEVKFFIELFA